ncbi:protein tyrosine phosphatase type IVA 1-like [Rattus norvegicus]|uniref:protein tyrosine phosphatase type IVA 1-like n=1 Tax=Rattus norvegicus TaxID=10116 RepID=UPI002FD843C2
MGEVKCLAPVEVTNKNMRFLLTHNPTSATLNNCIEEVKSYAVTPIGRVCEATYNTALVQKEGILEKFRPKMWLCFKDSNGHRNNGCTQ